MCALLDLDASELEDIEELIANATSIETLPDGILNTSHLVKHKIQAAIGDDILGPAQPVFEPVECPITASPMQTSSAPETLGSVNIVVTCDSRLSQLSPSTNTTAPTASSAPSTSNASTERSTRPAQSSRKGKSIRHQHPPVLTQPPEHHATQTTTAAPAANQPRSKPANRRRNRRRPKTEPPRTTPPAPPQAAAQGDV